MANTPRWNKIDLKHVNWMKLRSQGVVGGLYVLPNPFFADDRTNAFVASPKLPHVLSATEQQIGTCAARCVQRGAELTTCVHSCLQ